LAATSEVITVTFADDSRHISSYYKMFQKTQEFSDRYSSGLLKSEEFAGINDKGTGLELSCLAKEYHPPSS
jgi:hypothetical protein